ncbi:MAG: RNA polymerase sigma factor [Desulfobacterales bacterium]|nr:RNA polymerase sigma factor [Desulfobacterales bacterium]
MVENAPASQPDPDGSQEERALVLSAMEGNRFAFQQLMAIYEDKIYRMIFFRTRSRLDAEDICQDVFIQAFKSLKRLKDPDRFAGWLFRIAANRVKDHYRRRQVRSIFSFLPDVEREADAAAATDGEGAGAMENIERQEFWNRVNTMLDRLSRMEKEVFLLRFFDDLGIREISEVINKSQSTVKTHLYRALKKFKDDEAFRDFLREAVS